MANNFYIGVDNTAKKVNTIYTSVLSEKVIIKNLCPAINGAEGFTVGGGSSNTIESSTTYTKYSEKSLKLTGNASHVEVCAQSSITLPLNSKHKYYGRIEAYQETAGGGIDLYWPIAEPNIFSHASIGAAGQWHLHSALVERSSFSDGAYAFRLDLNNNNTSQQAWYDGWMIIDLTAAFGVGNEPTKDWCDKNIPYFVGKKEINRPQPIYIAKKVVKGYVGVNGKAKVFYKRAKVVTKNTVHGLAGVAAAYSVSGTVGDYGVIAIGRSATSTYSTTVYAYTDLLTRITAPSLAASRSAGEGCTNSKYVYFAGGSSRGTTSGYLKTVEVFDKDLVKQSAPDLANDRREFASAMIGDKVIFAGGYSGTGTETNTVDFYTPELTKGTLSTLHAATHYLGGASVGDYALFAGGYKTSSANYSEVTVYNKDLIKQNNLSLSVARESLRGGTMKNYALFSGGYLRSSSACSAVTDVFDKNLVRTTPSGLSVARFNHIPVSFKDCVIFAGGESSNTIYGTVDVYDDNLTISNPTAFSSTGANAGGVAIGNYAIYIGGETGAGVGTTSTLRTQINVYEVN